MFTSMKRFSDRPSFPELSAFPDVTGSEKKVVLTDIKLCLEPRKQLVRHNIFDHFIKRWSVSFTK